MNRIANRAMALLVLVIVLVGGFVFFLSEYFVKSEKWVMDYGSPHVYDGGNIGCGVVVDRDGALLLDLNGGRTYSNLQSLRKSTIHWVGDKEGNILAPALTHYAKELAGYDRFNGVYSYGQSGGVAELTLSAKMQTAALEALGDYKGTIAVYNYETGEILCAVTTPTYDPDSVPDLTNDPDGVYEGVYVNRFTQSGYIPGSIFKIVTLAAALETSPDVTTQFFACTGSYMIGSEEITCEDIHGTQSLKEAFCNSCNCAFAQIALQLGGDTLQEYVAKFGVVDALSFDGITTAKGNFQAAGAEDLNVAWSAIGQHLDQVNPCAFLAFMGAVANDGVTTMPHLVNKITVGGSKTYSAAAGEQTRIMSAETAATLQEYLQNNVVSKYGAENFPNLTVGAKTGTGEVGGEKKPNAMLAGYVENTDLPLAFVACVEDAGYGRAVCIPMISAVLAAAG